MASGGWRRHDHGRRRRRRRAHVSRRRAGHDGEVSRRAGVAASLSSALSGGEPPPSPEQGAFRGDHAYAQAGRPMRLDDAARGGRAAARAFDGNGGVSQPFELHARSAVGGRRDRSDEAAAEAGRPSPSSSPAAASGTSTAWCSRFVQLGRDEDQLVVVSSGGRAVALVSLASRRTAGSFSRCRCRTS